MTEDKNYYNSQKVIVTGASGFIGSHMCRELISCGAKVVAFIRNNSDLWRLKDILNEVELIEIDMLDYELLRVIIGKSNPNLIFHFAIPSSSFLQNDKDLQDQIQITKCHLTNLFKAVHITDTKIDAFVHACSGSIYKWNEENYTLSETTDLSPSTLRGKLKLEQRNLCMELAENYQIPLRLARIFRAYGPMETRTKLIMKALEAHSSQRSIQLGSNRFKRDYIYIDDLIRGILLLGSTRATTPVELNFGGESAYSAEEVILHLEQVLGSQIPKELNTYAKNLHDQGNLVANCSLAKQVLGWEPTTTLEEGLREMVSWYQSKSIN